MKQALWLFHLNFLKVNSPKDHILPFSFILLKLMLIVILRNEVIKNLKPQVCDPSAVGLPGLLDKITSRAGRMTKKFIPSSKKSPQENFAVGTHQ